MPGRRSLHRAVDRVAGSHPGSAVAVAWRDLHTGRFLYIRADRSFHAASTVKLGLMMEAYRLRAQGGLSFDAPVTLYNRFSSAADGSVYELSPEDDADANLYQRIGQQVTVAELIESAICLSGNLSANVLVEMLGANSVNRLFSRLRARGVVLRRGFMDLKAYEAGINNTVTARGLIRLLLALARGRVAGADADGEMVRLMMKQVHREGIPRGVPAEALVANKTGWFPGVHHDAALVFPPGRLPYALVVLTEGIPERARSAALMAEVSSLVYSAALSSNGRQSVDRQI